MPNSDDNKQIYFSSVAPVVFNADLFSGTNPDVKKFEKIKLEHLIAKGFDVDSATVAISTYQNNEKQYSNIIVYPVIALNLDAPNQNPVIKHQALLAGLREKNPKWISAPKTDEENLGQTQTNLADTNSDTGDASDTWSNLSSESAPDTNKVNDPESFKNISDRKITHIIPTVIPGHLQKMGIGQVGHIVLSVVTQQPNETFEYAYQHHKKTFDPRDLGLSAQNTFDDTNCGRYVTAMTIQAAGLARDGFVIHHANLRVSPAVGAALHFNSEEDAKTGLKHAYVKPLSEKPTYQEIIDHNVAKIQCLKDEYTARIKQPERQYHGTALLGGYKFASFFAQKLGYSATEKLDVIETLDFDCKGNHSLQLLTVRGKKIATQGRLGECVKAILKAQEQAKESDHNFFEKIKRFGL